MMLDALAAAFAAYLIAPRFLAGASNTISSYRLAKLEEERVLRRMAAIAATPPPEPKEHELPPSS